MAIISSGIYPINPNVTDGTQLANYINELVTAINSNQASATRPPLITKGGVWTKLVNETDVDVMVYDGTTDFKVASIVNGEIIDVDGIPEAPADGKQYARQDENWTEVNHPASNKNLLINSEMRIAQRGPSSSSYSSGDTYLTLDRWRNNIITAGTWTMSQDSDVPTGQGFATSMKWDCTTANGNLSANSFLYTAQFLEGQNLQHLKKGTSNAESLTLSFWVKSNKTGTYIAFLYDNDNTRLISKAYTINVADTWEKKTITYAGDTTGPLDNDNNRSLDVRFMLAAGTDWTSGTLQTSWGTAVFANRAVGQVNLADSTSNYINITGVQLEVGDTATPFEHRPYDLELQRCQRYFESIGDEIRTFVMTGYGFSPTQTNGVLSYKNKRATPTISQYNASGASGEPFSYNNISGVSGDLNTFSPNTISLMSCAVNLTISSGTLASGNPANISLRSERGYYIHINSEL